MYSYYYSNLILYFKYNLDFQSQKYLWIYELYFESFIYRGCTPDVIVGLSILWGSWLMHIVKDRENTLANRLKH